MQTTQNKTLYLPTFQNQRLFHVNNFKKYVAVTSLLNDSKKSLNNKKEQSNAFAPMFIKSLSNRYAVTGLYTDKYVSRSSGYEISRQWQS